MDIATQSEIVLRDSGYETWSRSIKSRTMVCFENIVVVGFVHVFSSAKELLEKWETAQHIALFSHSTQLRLADLKAWNVYSIFLAEDGTKSDQYEVERVEENLTLARKIARINVRTRDDVKHALLPLTAVKTQPMISDANFESRFRSRLRSIPDEVLNAFLGDVEADEIAKMLMEKS
ncbi:MAG: hypothetical protein ISN28_12680 [Ectothiorhodospiraceae bacterium AqS1]|nr:hypothetical protein [Ectothiorhodospiraceae bacterium AqS1]